MSDPVAFDYHEAVTAFLADPANLPFALEVSRHVETLRDRLHTAFWEEFRRVAALHLVEGGHNHIWHVSTHETRGPLDTWYYIEYKPQTAQANVDGLHLSVHLEQGARSNEHPLFLSFAWSRPLRESLELDELTNLRTKFEQHRFRAQQVYHFAYQDLDVRVRNDDFLIRVARDKNKAVQQVFDVFWAFFQDFRDDVHAVNRALAAIGA